MKLIKTAVFAMYIMGFTNFVYGDQSDLDGFREQITDTWKLIKYDRIRDIKLYIRQEDDKTYRSFKIIGTLNCTPETLYRVLLDFDNYPKWYWNVKHIQQLSRSSEKEYFLYLIHDVPLDDKDYDVVLKATVTPASVDNPKNIISVSAQENVKPIYSSMHRMTAENMVISFAQITDKKTQIEVVGYIEPSIKAPTWIINSIQKNAPYSNMLGLMRMINKPIYQNNAKALPFYVYSK